MSRAEEARAAGIERQALRDAVLRFNAEGLAGLVDRPYGRRPERQVECRMTDSLRASATRLSRARPSGDGPVPPRAHPD
jgi:winged helix-turn helix protein